MADPFIESFSFMLDLSLTLIGGFLGLFIVLATIYLIFLIMSLVFQGFYGLFSKIREKNKHTARKGDKI